MAEVFDAAAAERMSLDVKSDGDADVETGTSRNVGHCASL